LRELPPLTPCLDPTVPDLLDLPVVAPYLTLTPKVEVTLLLLGERQSLGVKGIEAGPVMLCVSPQLLVLQIRGVIRPERLRTVAVDLRPRRKQRRPGGGQFAQDLVMIGGPDELHAFDLLRIALALPGGPPRGLRAEIQLREHVAVKRVGRLEDRDRPALVVDLPLSAVIAPVALVDVDPMGGRAV